MPARDSITHAAQVRESLRSLAHTSRAITDPGEIYNLLGDLAPAMNSLAQSLHQIAGVHDRLEPGRAIVADSTRSGRATSYAISWEVHRVAEIVVQAAAGLDRVHQDESRISYAGPNPLLTPTPRTTPSVDHALRR